MVRLLVFDFWVEFFCGKIAFFLRVKTFWNCRLDVGSNCPGNESGVNRKDYWFYSWNWNCVSFSRLIYNSNFGNVRYIDDVHLGVFAFLFLVFLFLAFFHVLFLPFLFVVVYPVLLLIYISPLFLFVSFFLFLPCLFCFFLPFFSFGLFLFLWVYLFLPVLSLFAYHVLLFLSFSFYPFLLFLCLFLPLLSNDLLLFRYLFPFFSRILYLIFPFLFPDFFLSLIPSLPILVVFPLKDVHFLSRWIPAFFRSPFFFVFLSDGIWPFPFLFHLAVFAFRCLCLLFLSFFSPFLFRVLFLFFPSISSWPFLALVVLSCFCFFPSLIRPNVFDALFLYLLALSVFSPSFCLCFYFGICSFCCLFLSRFLFFCCCQCHR